MNHEPVVKSKQNLFHFLLKLFHVFFKLVNGLCSNIVIVSHLSKANFLTCFVMFTLIRFHNSWLRFSCQCEHCKQSHSGQRTIDTLSIPEPLEISDFSLSSKFLKMYSIVRENFF